MEMLLTILLLTLAVLDLLERVRGDREDEFGVGRMPLDCAIVACKFDPKKIRIISDIM